MTTEAKITEAKILLLVERDLDKLVKRAEEAIRQTQAAQQKDLEESQLRNLQNLAATTDSILVIKNFIGYQIGRQALPQKFGKWLLQDLDQISDEAQKLCSKAGLQDDNLIRRARGEMMRYYFGLLNWRFVAERKGGMTP